MSAIAALVLLLAVNTPSPEFLLESHRAGIVRIGENADVLYHALNGEADLIDMKAAGMLTPLLNLTIGGREDASTALLGPSDRPLLLRRIHVRAPRFRTAAAIPPG